MWIFVAFPLTAIMLGVYYDFYRWIAWTMLFMTGIYAMALFSNLSQGFVDDIAQTKFFALTYGLLACGIRWFIDGQEEKREVSTYQWPEDREEEDGGGVTELGPTRLNIRHILAATAIVACSLGFVRLLGVVSGEIVLFSSLPVTLFVLCRWQSVAHGKLGLTVTGMAVGCSLLVMIVSTHWLMSWSSIRAIDWDSPVVVLYQRYANGFVGLFAIGVLLMGYALYRCARSRKE